MELAIPILAIGSAYILSNNNKTNRKPANTTNVNGYSNWLSKKQESDGVNVNEGYENMGDRRRLPNLDIMPDNYPVQKSFSVGTDINAYNNPNYAMDRYYNDDLAKRL